ncbi:MAG: hypothetical protein J0M12_13260 [Deltaproteobacteria bacterium]|nr:hypothetical protein [Deltaproteobacteria bacterium]
MAPRHQDQPNFLDAIFGLLFEPGSTVRSLLSAEKPPYGNTILLCFVLSVFVPIAAQVYKYGNTIFNSDAILSLSMIMLFTLLIFVLVEGIFLQLLGIHVTVRQLWSMVAYCVTPFVLALWLIYLFNYLAMGRLTLVTLFMTGSSLDHDKFIRIVPFAVLVAQLNVLVVFFHSVRYLGEMEWLTSALVTFLSLVPFYVALFVALSIGEIARHGTIALFQKVLISPLALTYFGHG